MGKHMVSCTTVRVIARHMNLDNIPGLPALLRLLRKGIIETPFTTAIYPHDVVKPLPRKRTRTKKRP